MPTDAAVAASILSTALPNPTKRPRQVFVAYSYKLYPKADYRKIYKELSDAFAVEFVFADEKITSLHILQKIAEAIKASHFGVYDISGWNPNVTLELGLAYGMSEKAFIAVDPSKIDAAEVPADLQGIDRIQYSSYTELQEGLAKLLSQELPIKLVHDVETQLEQLRLQATQLIEQADGLRITDIADLLGVSKQMAQLVVRPLVNVKVKMKGATRGARYYPLNPPGE